MDETDSPFVVLFGVAGVCLSSILSLVGAAEAASAAAGLLVPTPRHDGRHRHPLSGDSSNDSTAADAIPPVLPAVSAAAASVSALFFGAVMSIKIVGQLRPVSEGYFAYKGMIHLGTGLNTGVTAWTAGRFLSTATEAADSSMTDAVRHNRGIIMIGLSIASVLIMAAGFKVSLYLYDK